MSAASGATRPAAEIVATVAEPVASRMPTAMSQPSSSAGIGPVLGEVQDHLADADVDQRLLEAAARADDQQDAGDRHEGLLDRRGDPPLVKPAALPSVNMPTITATSSAISGEPITSTTRCTGFSGSSTTMSPGPWPASARRAAGRWPRWRRSRGAAPGRSEGRCGTMPSGGRDVDPARRRRARRADPR